MCQNGYHQKVYKLQMLETLWRSLVNVGRNVNWCNYHGKQYRSSLKEIKTELSYDPAIPHLAIYPEKMKTLIQKDTHTPMLTALFTKAKIRK